MKTDMWGVREYNIVAMAKEIGDMDEDSTARQGHDLIRFPRSKHAKNE